MKIYVFTQGATRGIAEYGIEPDRKNDAGNPYSEDMEFLRSLLPRIKTMAQQELGDDFVGLEDLTGMFVLRVKQGTSTRKRFELRALIGWIKLFVHEPQISGV